MGQRGPTKKPTELKILQGVPGGTHKLNPNEPKPEKLSDLAPHPELTELGKEIWNHLADKLSKLNLLTEIDALSLMRLCDVYEKWILAKRFLDTKGFTYSIFESLTPEQVAAGQEPQLKYSAQYPEVSIYAQLGKELTRLCAQFGLSPAARASLNMDKSAGSTAKDGVKSRLYG